MATFEVTVDGDVLVFVGTGDVSAEDLVTAISDHYPTRLLKHAIWDFSECTLDNLTTESIMKVMSHAQEHMKARQGGKTAIVGRRDLEYGLGRLYSAVVDHSANSVLTSVFRTRQEAEEWLVDPSV